MLKTKTLVSFLFAVFVAFFAMVNLAHADEKLVSPVVASSEVININTADAKTIASALKGIGMKKAQAIVEYRETYGAFHDVQELVEVKGIGKKTLERNASLVVVD